MSDDLVIRLPYPGTGNGKTLRPGNLYDYEEWGAFLELHHFSINDVYRIDFLDDGRFTVYRYRRNSIGAQFLCNEETREIATMESVTVTPKAPIPAWS